MKICMIPASTTILIAVILNFLMIANIHKRHGFKRNTYLLFANIGRSNTAFSLSLVLRGMTVYSGNRVPVAVESAVVSLNLALSFAQLLANIALAFDRYCAAKFPLKYKKTAKIQVWKKPILVGEIICLMIGSGVGCLGAVYDNKIIATKTLMASRSIAILLLAYLYFKVFMTFKYGGVNASKKTIKTFQRNRGERRGARSKNEKHLLKMCMGITSSFTLLNLPLSIYTAIDELAKDCDTLEGKLLACFVFFTTLNMAFDPFWYFYMEKRKGQRNIKNGKV